MESVIIFILGIIAGAVGYVKLVIPAQTSTPPDLPPEPLEPAVSKPVDTTGKRKTISIKTAKEKYRAITRAKLPSKALLNGEEKIVFKALSEFIERWNSNDKNPESARGLLLLAQVSIGEIIGLKGKKEEWEPEERDAWHALQGRRADFLLVDRDFMPVVVIEHQGSGHFQDNWEERDKDKMTAYGYAGIPVVETYANTEGNRTNHLKQTHIIGGLVAGKLNEKYNLKAS